MAGIRKKITYEVDASEVRRELKDLGVLQEKQESRSAKAAQEAIAAKREALRLEKLTTAEAMRSNVLNQARNKLRREERALTSETARIAKAVTSGEITQARAGKERIAAAAKYKAIVHEIVRATGQGHASLKKTNKLLHDGASAARGMAKGIEDGDKRLNIFVSRIPAIPKTLKQGRTEAEKLALAAEKAMRTAANIHVAMTKGVHGDEAAGKTSATQRQQREVKELGRHWQQLDSITKDYQKTGKSTTQTMAKLNAATSSAASRFSKARIALDKLKKGMTAAELSGMKLDKTLNRVRTASFTMLAGVGERLARGQIGEMDHAQRRVDILAKKFNTLGSALDRLKGKLTPTHYARLQMELAKTGREVDKARGKLLKLKTAADSTGKSTEGLGSRFMKFRGNLLGLVVAIPGVAAVIGGLRRAFRGLIEETTDFDTQLGQVHTLIPATTHEIEMMERRIESMSKRLAKTPGDITKGLYFVISAGVRDTADALLVLEAATEVAVAGLADTEVTVDALTTILNAYNFEAKDADRITDLFFKTVEQGKLTFSDLAANIGIVASAASVARVSIEEVLSMIAALTAAGLDVAEATISLDRLITSIVSATPQARRAADALGIDLSQAAIDATGVMGVLDEVIQKTGADAQQLIKIFPQIRARRIVTPFASSGVREHQREALDSMSEAAGAAELALAKMQERLDNQWQLLKNRLFVAWEESAHWLLRMRNRVIDLLVPLGEAEKIMHSLANLDLEAGERVGEALTRASATIEMALVRQRLMEAGGMTASGAAATQEARFTETYMDSQARRVESATQAYQEFAETHADVIARVRTAEDEGMFYLRTPAEALSLAKDKGIVDRARDLMEMRETAVSTYGDIRRLWELLSKPPKPDDGGDDPIEWLAAPLSDFIDRRGDIEKLIDTYQDLWRIVREAEGVLKDKPSAEAAILLEEARKELGEFLSTFPDKLGALVEPMLPEGIGGRDTGVMFGDIRVEVDRLLDTWLSLVSAMKDAELAQVLGPSDETSENLKNARIDLGDFITTVERGFSPGAFELFLSIIEDLSVEAGLMRGEIEKMVDASKDPGRAMILDEIDDAHLDDMRNKLKRLRDAEEKFARDQAKRWKKSADAMKDVAKGTLKVLEGFGLLDKSTRKVLEGIIGIADAAAKVHAMKMAGESLSFTNIATPVMAGVTALALVLQGVFRDNTEQLEKMWREERDAMRRLSESMDRLAEEMRATSTPGQVEGDRALLESLIRQHADDS